MDFAPGAPRESNKHDPNPFDAYEIGSERQDLDPAQIALNGIKTAQFELVEAEARFIHSVVEAKLAGATYAQIGENLGTTRQSAYDRFAKYIPKTNSRKLDNES